MFEDLTTTFGSRTFSRPAKMAALERIGHLVKKVRFVVPRTDETLLPPLIDPWTGEEKDFVYAPQAPSPASSSSSSSSSPLSKTQGRQQRKPKYGDWETTDLLVKQYPPLFHAATNSDALVKAFSALPNLTHLEIKSLDTRPPHQNQRSVVDYILISLKLTLERAGPASLYSLTLTNMDMRKLVLISPGSGPGSTRVWARIRNLNLQLLSSRDSSAQRVEVRVLHGYLCSFTHLECLDFSWIGSKGPSPIPSIPPATASKTVQRQKCKHRCHAPTPLFPRLTHLFIANAVLPARQIRDVIQMHRRTLEDLDLKSVEVSEGTWEEAFEGLDGLGGRYRRGGDGNGDRSEGRGEKGDMGETGEMGDVPIMLAPSLVAGRLVGGDMTEETKEAKTQRRDYSGLAAGAETGKPVRRDQYAWPSDHRKEVVGDSCAAEGVRVLLSEQPNKARKKKRDFWACRGVLQAVKGSLMNWR